jgi:hypothetical protein
MSEFGYIPEAPEQSAFNNKGIFTPKDIYNLDQEDKWTQLGQLELIQTQTVSSSTAVVDFTNIKEDEYNVHFLTMNNGSGTTATDIDILLSDNGGSSFITSGYQYGIQFGTSGGNFGEDRNTNDGKIMWTQGSATENGYAYFYNLGDSAKYSFITNHCAGINGTKFGSGVKPTTQVINAIRVDGRNHNFSTVDLSLYGIRYS